MTVVHNVVGLIRCPIYNKPMFSGGKDSIYNLHLCKKQGHSILALGNLYPPSQIEELDSYMYQSIGHTIIPLIAYSLGLPLYRREITGIAKDQGLGYQANEGDETEDLYNLLNDIKTSLPEITAVSVGAIASTYQYNRVVNICERLNLTPLCYLWRRDQKEILQEMVDFGLNSILVKTASMGLDKQHLGLNLKTMLPELFHLHDKYGVHPCGEGGEFESLTLYCPGLYSKKIQIKSYKVIETNSCQYWVDIEGELIDL